MENVRVLPLLVFVGLCLFVLKSMGLFLSGGYVLSGVAPANAQDPQAQDTREAAGDENANNGAVPPVANENAQAASGPAETSDNAVADNKPRAETAGGAGPVDAGTGPREAPLLAAGPGGGATKSELAVLEGLANRRKTLDQRARELDLQENLLKAAEKRVEARIAELKAIEGRIEGELQKQDDDRAAQYERLVKMYSGMKPKDAARIFDRLEMDVLTGLVSQMKPRVMSAILAAMTPAAAERLTMEMASRGENKPETTAALPKIQSR